MNISKVLLPIFVLIIIIHGLYKKIDIYEVFIRGVKEGLIMSINIFPTIFAMSLAINILIKSNLLKIFIDFISPLTYVLSIPKEVLPLSILRPISGSSTLILLDNILKIYTPDSFIGRVASIIQGSSDTTIYIIGLYFGSIGIKKIKHSLFVGLLSDFICVIIAVLVVKIIF